MLADNALTTLATAKQAAGIAPEDTANDALIGQLINEASAWVESQLDRKLRRQTYTQRLKPNATQELPLNQWPLIGVVLVEVAGVALDPDRYDWQTYADAGILYKDDGWRWRGYVAGLAYDPIATSQDIKVVYTAGYVLPKDATDDEPRTLPYDLEGLVLDMVATTYAQKTSGAAGLKSFGISDVRWDWDREQPPAWAQIIERHRRVWL